MLVLSRLRRIIPLLLCILLLFLISDSVVFGQDADTDQPASGQTKSFRSPRLAVLEVRRVLALADQAELVALGKVGHSHSFWSEDSAIIETETTITLERVVKGTAPAEIVVRSEGGFIADENIGMIAPHEVSFVVGEAVVIFADKQGGIYHIQDGAAGKLSMDGNLVGGDLLFATDGRSVDDLIESLARTSATASASASHATANRRWKLPDATVAFRINVNTAQKDADKPGDAFVSAITNAAATWNRTPGADFTLEYVGATDSTQTGYNHVNEVVFMHKGRDDRGALAQVWYTSDLTIIEADIWINEDFVWDVSGDLPGDGLDLQSALLHEFGHWLILNHTDDSTSVMYPTLAPGIEKRVLARRDAEGISAIYPCLQAACVFGR